jgi:hypothetical protein
LRESLFQGQEVRDHVVKPGDREDTEDGGATEDQQRPASLGLRSLVRTQQCVKPGRIAKLRPGHIDYERPVRMRGRLQQRRPQPGSSSNRCKRARRVTNARGKKSLMPYHRRSAVSISYVFLKERGHARMRAGRGLAVAVTCLRDGLDGSVVVLAAAPGLKSTGRPSPDHRH